MTELNQRISAVTREVVETGETVRVTNRGRVVLRLVPEAANTDDPVGALIDAGLARAPRQKNRSARPFTPVEISRGVDELLSEVSREVEY